MMFQQFQGQIDYIRRLRHMMVLMKRNVAAIEAISHSQNQGLSEPGLYRKTLYRQMVTARRFVQLTAEQYQDCTEALRQMRRRRNLHRRQGVTILLEEAEVKKMAELAQEIWGQLGDCGFILAEVMDLWQVMGGTREELFSLCCCSPAQIEKIPPEDELLRYSVLVWRYKLDWHDGWTGRPFRVGAAAPMTTGISASFPQRLSGALRMRRPLGHQPSLFQEQPSLPLEEPAKQALVQMFWKVYSEPVGAEEPEGMGESPHSKFRAICDRILERISKRGYGDKENAVRYFSECSQADLEEWWDMVCPRLITKGEIVEILKEELGSSF